MSKLEKLCVAYETFGLSIANVPDQRAVMLHRMCAEIRKFVQRQLQTTPKPRPSQIAAGLEQGWRETPELIQDVAPEWRADVSKAWRDATQFAYPEYLNLDVQRLQKVLERGRIRTEAEFYRVRHEIDLIEGEVDHYAELQRLYDLIAEYEAR